jgi:hypothetical protein
LGGIRYDRRYEHWWVSRALEHDEVVPFLVYPPSGNRLRHSLFGTSLIAIMLGRLRMPLKEVETEYLKFSESIFQPKRNRHSPGRAYDFMKASAKFDSKPLEDRIKDILRAKDLPEDTLLKDEDEDLCKV